jgi:hypothetical protein
VLNLLAYDLFLKNRSSAGVNVPKVFPIKKVFVSLEDVITVKLDSKTLEYYGKILNQNSSFDFQEKLNMPLNNLPGVGLPNKATGANSKKPYVELYGIFDKSKLTLSITGKNSEGKKETFAYEYNFANDKETITSPTGDLMFLRLDAECYFVDDKLLFDLYKDAGVIVSEGAVPHQIFTNVCKAFSSFWKKQIVFEDLKKHSRFTFRIVILPFSLLSQGKVEYRSQEEFSTGESFEDCFGNLATGYPSKPTINAKFFSFDDEAFTINCKTGKDFYQNLGIGNVSFDKINLPSDRVIRIAGLEWYFFELSDSSLNFETKNSGIYDQLLSNYNVLSRRAGLRDTTTLSSLKIICAKRAQAKIEVLLDDNLTLDQLKTLLSRAQDDLKYHPLALESLIVENSNRDIIWSDYIAAIRHFINGTYFGRAVLLQRLTCIVRDRNHLQKWLKGEKTDEFFVKSQFCLDLLTITENGKSMDQNEEYAYKIGVIAGKYVKYKQETKETNNSTKDILTYSKYDRERLRFVYRRVGIGISLSKANIGNLTQTIIENNAPKEEIDDTHAHDDYSYFFYKGVFENLI